MGPPHAHKGKIHDSLIIKDEDFHIWELDYVIRKLQNNKAPGPDNVITEFIKWLNTNNRKRLLYIINLVVNKGELEHTLHLASVASIYKKGDSSNLANYRPISLLQTFYKIIASLIKERIDAGLDSHMHNTQYGFRRAKSTAQALYIARRLMDISEKQGTNLTLILLDWEKAFDKTDHNRLMEALKRLNLPPKYIQLIGNIYDKPQFKVVSGEHQSEYKTQHTGIRQGCPLSPYLFILVMTVLMHD